MSADAKSANPAPLGLLGFGMTTILLNIHNAGFFPISAMILAMGIFYGGIAQVIAGILEYKKGNTFACRICSKARRTAACRSRSSGRCMTAIAINSCNGIGSGTRAPGTTCCSIGSSLTEGSRRRS